MLRQSQFYGISLGLRYSCGKAERTSSGMSLVEYRLHFDRKGGYSLRLVSSNLVLLRISFVQVSRGTADEQLYYILNAFTPLTILKSPPSPQKLPQELRARQYFFYLSTPQPVMLTKWVCVPFSPLSSKIPFL